MYSGGGGQILAPHLSDDFGADRMRAERITADALLDIDMGEVEDDEVGSVLGSEGLEG